MVTPGDRLTSDPMANGGMTTDRLPPPHSTLLLRWLVVAVAYFVAGRIGLSLASINPSASAVWAPTGLALAAVLILGPRRTGIGILVGAFTVNLLTSDSAAIALAIAVGNTLEALLGGYLVTRFAGGRAGWCRTGNLFRFVVLATASTTVSATIGVTALYLAGSVSTSAYLSVWTTWWLGDTTGALLVAPVILLWHAAPRPNWTGRQRVEILALGLTTALIVWMVFVRVSYPLTFLCIPVCVWAGMRFGQREASTTACALSAIAVWGAVRGQGALASVPVNTQLLIVQAFTATTGIVGLVIGAAVWESKRAERDVRRLNDELGARVRERTAELQAALDGARLSESRLAEAQQVGHVGSWEWTVAENSQWWSDELYRMCGYEPRSFAPAHDTFLNALPPDDRERVSQIVRQAFVDHRSFQFEHSFIRPDRTVRTFFSQGHVVVDDAGHVIRMLGATHDITDRRAAERRWQTIFDAQPACVKVVSVAGRVLQMNPAGLDMIDADSLSQVAGHPVIDLIHPDDRRPYLEAHGAVSAGTPNRLAFRIVGLKGNERWVDSHMVPFDTVVNGSGTQRTVLSVTSDMTDSKRLEQHLRQSQKMEAIGLMAGGVAHDFNNLLVPIAGYSDLVMETLDESDPRRAELQEVRKAAERATALTRQLLAFSRRQVLQPKVLDLNALIGGIHKLLTRTIPERVNIVLSLDAVLDPVRADRGQLEQVLVNLAVNAADAMPDGGELRIASTMSKVDEHTSRLRLPMIPGRYVKLTVSDTGAGMSPDTQARIFEPFFSTKGPGRGTGLGLSTVYGIIKQSGGYIWVSSSLGQGTTFEVYLPAVQAPVDADLPVASQTELVRGSETILVAEDDGAVRRLASDVLRRYGYTVLEARDGEEALSLAQTYDRDIDLLMTDMVMPGLSGLSLAARLTAVHPRLRVLYSSGYTEYMYGKPTALGASLPFLAKPYSPTTLLHRVREVLDGSPSAPTARPR